MNTGPVVVGIDGSTSSKNALRWAAEYARTCGTTLVAVTAWEIGPSYGYPFLVEDSDFEDFTSRTRATLHDAVQEVVDGSYEVEQRVERGHPAAALLGSVSQHCVSHAPCPVVIVPHVEPKA